MCLLNPFFLGILQPESSASAMIYLFVQLPGLSLCNYSTHIYVVCALSQQAARFLEGRSVLEEDECGRGGNPRLYPPLTHPRSPS
jgi:hypothetical protein